MSWIERLFLRVAHQFFSKWPQPVPQKKRLKQCKLVSHRGDHDNIRTLENTIPAFDRVHEHRVWGIELDVRWTSDLHPVVFHDRDLQRVFGREIEIGKTRLNQLKSDFPQIPSLAEVVDRYGKILHLMVEIKKEVYPDPEYQNKVLSDIFSNLEPLNDYHFLSLTPEMFGLINMVPSSTFLPIAQRNIRPLSSLAIRQNYRGITGHYLLVTNRLLKLHQKRNQSVGTGFVNSTLCLFREINRGVDWIFSDNATKLQSICNRIVANKG
jgi:glycerophosphoryl diester phosphodiesterase